MSRAARRFRYNGARKDSHMIRRMLLLAIGAVVVVSSVWLSAQGGAAKNFTAQDFVDIQQLYAKYNWSLDAGDAEAYARPSHPTAPSTTTSATTRS